MWTYGPDQCLSVLEGSRGRPQPLDFGHVPWSPNHWALDVGRKRLALPTLSARYGRLVRSALRSFSVRSPYVVGLLTSLPPFSWWNITMPELQLCLRSSPALAGMSHSSRSSGKESSLSYNHYGNESNRIFWELLGNSLIVTLWGLLLFFLDRAALPHSTRPALFTNLYNRCHRDSQLYYRINKETGDDLAPDIRRCGKSSC